MPVALAEMNGQLRTGSKSILADTSIANIDCPSSIDCEGTACIIIDGQALVQSIGKPAEAKTFGDFGETFAEAVMYLGHSYQRIDIFFDRYRRESIKSATREKRTSKIHPIRRVIEDRHVPLPHNWANFIALPENKADLANFLSNELIHRAPNEKLVVVAVDSPRSVRYSVQKSVIFLV